MLLQPTTCYHVGLRQQLVVKRSNFLLGYSSKKFHGAQEPQAFIVEWLSSLRLVTLLGTTINGKARPHTVLTVQL